MKIALVCPYDFAYPGGVVNHITALEEQLRRIGHDVRIIAPASTPITGYGERFITIGKPRPMPASGSVARITISLRLAKRIKEVLVAERFDIIHLHEPFMIMLCSAVLRFSQTVNVGTFHATEGKPGYRLGWPMTRILLNRRARKLHGRIAVSVPAWQYHSRYVKGDYDIIPNGIDLAHFNPAVRPMDEFNDGKLNILFVGRLERRKGLNYLIEAYARVSREIPDSRLIVVGPGTRLRPEYEALATDCGVKDKVVFVGGVSHDDLPRYYQTADIFCAPATGHESFGIVLLEAMAMGKAVIASKISGYASVLTHGQEGLLVKPCQSVELAQAIRELADDTERRREMGRNGLQTARKYNWPIVAERIIGVYEKTLKTHSSGKQA